jgi:Ca-activated chloride channel homolog
MEFAAPQYGCLALAVFLIVFLKLRGERVRGEQLQRFAEAHLLQKLVPPQKKIVWTARHLVSAGVMLLLVLALMRPQWGLVEEEQRTSGMEIIVALDLSRSMLADDVAPSRLAAAKAAVTKMMQAMPEDHIGIVGFAGTAFLLCPVTSDHEMVARILDEVGTRTLPKGGTALAAALAEASRAFRHSKGAGKVLVLLTDGEDQAGDVTPALHELQNSGVTIIGSLVGTALGAVMPIGEGAFVKDKSGAVVKSVADLDSIRRLDASASPLSASASEVAKRISEVRRGAGESVRKERRRKLRDRYEIPLSAALILWLPGLIFSRRGEWL